MTDKLRTFAYLNWLPKMPQLFLVMNSNFGLNKIYFI